MINFRDGIDRILGSDYCLYADYMPWYGTPGEVHKANYSQMAPGVMDAQLDNMQDSGIEGVRCTYMGSNPKVGPFGHQVAMAMAAKCVERNMRFMFLMDPWDVKQFAAEGYGNKEAAMIATFQNKDVAKVLDSKAYVDPYVMEFSTGVEIAKVQAALPKGFTVGSWHKHFSWPSILVNPDKTLSGWDVSSFVKDAQGPGMVMPAVFRAFFDGGFVTNKTQYLASVAFGKPYLDIVRDWNTCVWGTAAAASSRYIPSDAGNTWLSSIEALALVSPKPKIVSVVSWNDYDEGTQVEDIAVMSSGIRLSR